MSRRAIRGSAATAIAILGQSNGEGHPDATPVPTRTISATGELWIDGVDQSAYGAVEDRVAVESLLAPSRRVTKSAQSNTSIAEWLGGLLDDAFGHAEDASLAPTVTLWIQGERDSREEGGWATYATSLGALLDAVETEWGAQTLIVIPYLSGLPADPYTRMGEVNAAFDAVAAARANVVLIETADLEKQGDNVHYTRAGYDRLAVRIRDALVEHGL